MVTRAFDSYVDEDRRKFRKIAVSGENIALRRRLKELGTQVPPLPSDQTGDPDEENFYLKKYLAETQTSPGGLGRFAGMVGRGIRGIATAANLYQPPEPPLPPREYAESFLPRSPDGTPYDPRSFGEFLQSPANISYLPSGVTEPLPPILQPIVENLTSPMGLVTLPFSPVRNTLSIVGGTGAQETARMAGAGSVGQTVAGIAGGFAGYPEAPIGAARLAQRGGGAALNKAAQAGAALERRGFPSPISEARAASGEQGGFRRQWRVTNPALRQLADQKAAALKAGDTAGADIIEQQYREQLRAHLPEAEAAEFDALLGRLEAVGERTTLAESGREINRSLGAKASEPLAAIARKAILPNGEINHRFFIEGAVSGQTGRKELIAKAMERWRGVEDEAFGADAMAHEYGFTSADEFLAALKQERKRITKTPSVTAAQRQESALKGRLNELTRMAETAGEPVAPAGQGVQTSMGIGEKSAQGTLMGAGAQADISPPLIDLEQQQAQAARRAAIRQGQAEIPVPEQPPSFREPGGLWVTNSLGERVFVQDERLTQAATDIANTYVEAPAAARNKAYSATRRLNKPEQPYIAGEMEAGPLRRQPSLTSPRGEELTPGGVIRKPPPPPTGEAAAKLPVEPPRPDADFPGMERPPLGDNIIGLKEITPGLTRGEEAQNILLGAGRKVKLPFHPNNEYGTAAIREKNRTLPISNSQATQFGHRQAVAVRQAFKLEDDLFVPSLAGKVSRVKGAPGIQDIVDFYPQYEPFLSAPQKAAVQPMIASSRTYKDLLNQLGIGFDSRPSTVIGGGEYIARVAKGLLKEEDVRGVPARGLFARAKKGFELEQKYETAAAGRAAGIKYAGIEETLKFHYQEAGRRAIEAHIANYLTRVVDDTNWPISLPRAGESGMLRKAVDLPILAEYSFPEAVADSINKVLVSEGTTVGAGRNALEAVRILNRGYRGVRATFDNSYMAIQMLLSAYAHPVAASKAARVNFRSWRDSNVLAQHMAQFDNRALTNGRLTSTQLVSEAGIHLGATTGEFGIEGLQKLPGFKQAGRAYGYTGDALRLEVLDSLLEQEMHGFRLFGKGPELFGKGRTLDEIRASGDLQKIGEIVNNMTGVARQRFGGDIGEILLFAPRFLQSRLETLAKGIAGLRPGASIDQKIARRSLLKMIAVGTALTVAINEMNGEETDFRPVVGGKKNPNFMRIRALGRDWSLFGTWDSLVGLLISAGHGDAESAVRSQASGLVTTTWDLFSGEDFLGRSTISPENKTLYVLRQLTPFSGEATAAGLEQTFSGKPQDIAGGLATAAGSFAGVKSSPLSFTDKANEIAGAKYDTTWDRLKSERKKAQDAAIAKNKTTSPEYERLDSIMDKIVAEVEKQYPEQAVPKRLTMAAKREEIARRLYDRVYGDLYPNQKVKVNKLIGAKGTAPSQKLPKGATPPYQQSPPKPPPPGAGQRP